MLIPRQDKYSTSWYIHAIGCIFYTQNTEKNSENKLAESILNGYNERKESTDKRLLSVNNFS